METLEIHRLETATLPEFFVLQERMRNFKTSRLYDSLIGEIQFRHLEKAAFCQQDYTPFGCWSRLQQNLLLIGKC